MWRDNYSYGEAVNSRVAVSGNRAETLGLDTSTAWRQRPARSVRLVMGSFTAAVSILAAANDLPPSQTLLAPDYSATARVLTPQRLEILPAAFQEAFDEMDHYKYLTAGWDGIGSSAPHTQVVDSALSFLLNLPFDVCPPEATVSADGSVGWFWKNDAVYATTSFSKAGRFAYYAKMKASGEKFKGIGVVDGSVPQELLDAIRVA